MTEPAGLFIDIADDGWCEAVAAPVDLVRQAARQALGSRAGRDSLSLRLSDDAEIRALNRRFRQQDRPTNVLSFPSGDALDVPMPTYLGDIIIARETVLREAQAAGKPVSDHLTHLVIHGVLHLLGFDHQNEAEAEAMEAAEIRLLAALDIPDPYATAEEVRP